MKKLLLLAGVGIAVKYFLDTDAGQQVKRQLEDWWKENQGDVKGAIARIQDDAASNIPKVK